MSNVQTLRKLLADRKATWSMANHLADSTLLSEIAKGQHLGALPISPSMSTTRLPRLRAAVDAPVVPAKPGTSRLLRRGVAGGALPTAWNWRNVGSKSYVSAVRDQEGCGSCVSFATTAAIEAHHRIETHQPTESLDLSEASLFFVANRQCKPGDPSYGWWVPSALDAAVSEGLCFEDNYPYRAVNQTADIPNGTVRTLKIRGYDSSTNTAQMKRWLVEDGPLVTAFTVYNDFFAFFNGGSGAYEHVTGGVAGGHAVCVIGYDDAASAWICKNSWGGNAAHPDGCFLIRYGQCGIDARMYVPQDVVDIFTGSALRHRQHFFDAPVGNQPDQRDAGVAGQRQPA